MFAKSSAVSAAGFSGAGRTADWAFAPVLSGRREEARDGVPEILRGALRRRGFDVALSPGMPGVGLLRLAMPLAAGCVRGFRPVASLLRSALETRSQANVSGENPPHVQRRGGICSATSGSWLARRASLRGMAPKPAAKGAAVRGAYQKWDGRPPCGNPFIDTIWRAGLLERCLRSGHPAYAPVFSTAAPFPAASDGLWERPKPPSGGPR